MSSPYLKVGFVCALFATVIGLAFYTLAPAEPSNDYSYNGLSQAPAPPPPPSAPMPPPPPPPPVDEVYTKVDEMPLFPGCEEVADYEERKSCADRKMLEYIYNNVKYPKEAKDKGVEGMAVVSFRISRVGKVYGAKLVRNPGAGTGDAALRTVKKMITDDIRWEPGRKDGKKVAVQFNLPVKFKLE